MAAVAMAASIFAVDFSATVKMDTNLFGLDGSKKVNDWNDGGKVKDSDTAVKFLALDKKDQKDSDALIMSVNGDKAGAAFQFWYNYSGDENDAIKVRNANIWFKPIDQLKITVGNNSYGTYKERMGWWRTATGASYTSSSYWSNRWSSFASVEGSGIAFDITPMDKLSINLGFDPGAGNSWVNLTGNDDGDGTVLAYGATVQYQILDNLSAAVSWRDTGINLGKKSEKDGADKGGAKILSVGADFGNWGTPYYGFLNARFYFNDVTDEKTGWEDADVHLSDKYGMGLRGIAIDNYFSYSLDTGIGKLKLEENCPITIRGLQKYDTDAEKYADPSYMTFAVKASLALDSLTPYLKIENNEDWTPIVFAAKEVKENFADVFGFNTHIGTTLNVGSCAIDASLVIKYVQYAYTSTETWKAVHNNAQINFAVPITFSIGF